MLNIPLHTKQVIPGIFFSDNLLTSTEKKRKTAEAKYKTPANIITMSIITQSTMQHEHKNTIT